MFGREDGGWLGRMDFGWEGCRLGKKDEGCVGRRELG